MSSAKKQTITVSGKSFDIPCLPFKKNRVVVPACTFALNGLDRATKGEPLNVTTIDYIYLAVFEAISFADAKVTREEFDTWGCNLPELVDAVKKISLQTGVLVQQSPSENKPAGEV